MKNISIKNKFLLFTIFIFFYTVFYLYFKKDVGNDTSISEWLINYNGGFTRRGLGGEINIFLANLFSISLRDAIFFIQALLHSFYLLLLFLYIRKFKLDITQFFALFSPLFLLYPIAELEALGRKEILIFLFFISTLFLCDKRFKPIFVNTFVFIFFPIVCFIWEEIILFAPFFAVVLIDKNKFFFFKDTIIKLLLIFFPSVVSIFIIFFLPLSNEGHSAMCEFLQTKFGEKCYMSAELLIENTIYFDTFFIHEKTKFFPHYLRYILIFFIGFLPLHLTIAKNGFTNKDNFITKNFSPIYLFILLYIPILLLFAFGHDWGRWVHITYSLSILLYFYFLKKEIITNNFHSNFLTNMFQKRKSILIATFFIFAFFWNPKTLITGDVATNSLYKIIYNSSKIIFNYGGLRIFQDHPLMKFHKKFIE